MSETHGFDLVNFGGLGPGRSEPYFFYVGMPHDQVKGRFT